MAISRFGGRMDALLCLVLSAVCVWGGAEQLTAESILNFLSGTHEVCYANMFKACLSTTSVKRSVIFLIQPKWWVNKPWAVTQREVYVFLFLPGGKRKHKNLMMMWPPLGFFTTVFFCPEKAVESSTSRAVSPCPLLPPALLWPERKGGGPSSLEGHVWTETHSRVPDIQISVTDVPLRFDANEGN